jgi:hypothetical protein
LKKCAVFLEANGGSGQEPGEHRCDSMPSVGARRASGWIADTICSRGVPRDDLFDRVVAKADVMHLEHGIQQKIAAEITRRGSQAAVPSPA